MDSLVAGFFTPQNIIDIQDVVTLLVIITVILDSFAGFGEDPPRVPGGFVVKSGVADAIRGRKIRGQRLKRLGDG